MIEEHPSVALARQLWNATAEGDPGRLRHLLEDHVVWRVFGGTPQAGEFIGPDQVIDHLAQLGEATDELRSTLHTIFYNDEGAVLFYGTEARRGSRRLTMDYLLMLRFRAGRVAAAFSVPTDQREHDNFWLAVQEPRES